MDDIIRISIPDGQQTLIIIRIVIEKGETR